MDDEELLRFVVDSFGAAWTAWVLNATVERVWEHRHGGSALDESQIVALRELVLPGLQILWGGRPAPLVRAMAYSSEHRATLATATRRALGGTLPDTTRFASDPVMEALSAFAADLFHAVLVDTAGFTSFPTFDLHPVRGDYPTHARALAAIEADPTLRTLIPGDGEHLRVTYADGNQQIIRRDEVVTAILAAATNHVVAAEEEVTPDRLFEQLQRDLDDLRALLEGAERPAPVLVGFSGIELPDAARVDLGDLGVLRAARRREQFDQGFDRSAASAVLARSQPQHLTVESTTDPMRSLMVRPYRRDPELLAAEHAAACVVLAVRRDEPLAPGVTWAAGLRPLDAFPQRTLGEIAPARPATAALTDAETEAVARFASAFATTHDASLDIALRRLLSALLRSDPQDALIDAVTVWENIAAVSAEVSFRVTATLAVLTEAEPSLRLAKRSRLSKIYGLRSKIVHGERPGKKQLELDEALPEARAASVDALRTLYDRYPHLIRDPGSRSDRLLLGYGSGDDDA